MMMIHYNQNHSPSHRIQHPTIEIPQWDPPYDDSTAAASPTTTTTLFSPQTNDYFRALQRYLPSSSNEYDLDPDLDSDDPDSFDSFSCDEFRMYEFKVRKCARGRSHDWTECPYAHPGEKARRRDPRRYHYSGTACPEFRRGSCRKGDACEYAHGVFECWLHPARYRTQPCKDGPNCKRRVCFFAHSPDQLRVLPHSPDQLRVLPHSPESPPSRLSESPPSELIEAMRGLRLGSGSGGLSMSPRLVGSGSGFGSPRSPGGFGYFGGGGGGGGGSVPSTPTRTPTGRSGMGLYDPWEMTSLEEEVPMERVESGKDLRARIYAKLSKENSLDRDRVDPASSAVPDFGWVSELVK